MKNNFLYSIFVAILLIINIFIFIIIYNCNNIVYEYTDFNGYQGTSQKCYIEVDGALVCLDENNEIILVEKFRRKKDAR